jgi:hypothetical protein
MFRLLFDTHPAQEDPVRTPGNYTEETVAIRCCFANILEDRVAVGAA